MQQIKMRQAGFLCYKKQTAEKLSLGMISTGHSCL